MAQKLDITILDLLESSIKNIKAHPLNLGGVSGVGGGAGGPPGGFIGWLPQTRVAYDYDEIAWSGTAYSGSLLDNLNHIRARLGVLESGGGAGTIVVIDDTNSTTYSSVDTIHFSGGVIVTNLGSGDIRVTVSGGSGGTPLVVKESDGSPSVSNVDTIAFSGMVVVDNGGGDVTVYPQPTYFDTRYLKLDASNDPVTGKLTIQVLTPYEDGLSVETNGDSITSQIRQFTSNTDSTQAGLLLQRQTTASGNITGTLLDLREYDTGTGIISGDFAKFSHEGTEIFKVTRSGTVNIPAGQTYNINNSPHTHSYVPENGWIAGTGTWSYSSADSPTFIINIPDADAVNMSVGYRIQLTQTTIKYFIVTAVGTPSGGFTPVTIYGGTDYTLANAAISSTYYSHTKVPLGFPVSPEKWTVTATDTTNRTQVNPTAGTWYNLGSVSISVPIGAWKVEISAFIGSDDTTATNTNAYATLSTANNSESNASYTTSIAVGGASGSIEVYDVKYKSFPLTVTSKTTYYLNEKVNVWTVNNLQLLSALSTTSINLVCAYL